MKEIIKYLHLDQVGILELLFAMYCILSGYGWGIIHGDMLFALVMGMIAYFRTDKHRFGNKELIWLIAFTTIHEIVLWVAISGPSYMLNNTISNLLVCLTILPICRALRYDKLIGSLNWVAIISMGGMLYHFLIIQSGGYVQPIPIPFLPRLDSSSRAFDEVLRPTSFYWEPAAYATFMMVPLFIALYEKKNLWIIAIIVSMFMSTSSTGILMSLLMLAIYMFTQKIQLKNKILVAIIGVGLVGFLLNSQLFTSGVDKINETDIETTSRLINGPELVSNMPFMDIVLGMPAANAYDYYIHEGGISPDIIVKNNGIFVSSFWLMLAKYGIIGLILYLLLYFKIAKTCRELLPYMLVLFVSMFFQSVIVGSAGFAFQLIFILAFKKQINNEDSNINNAICQ